MPTVTLHGTGGGSNNRPNRKLLSDNAIGAFRQMKYPEMVHWRAGGPVRGLPPFVYPLGCVRNYGLRRTHMTAAHLYWGQGPDLPQASARSDVIKWSRVLPSPTWDAAGSH